MVFKPVILNSSFLCWFIQIRRKYREQTSGIDSQVLSFTIIFCMVILISFEMDPWIWKKRHVFLEFANCTANWKAAWHRHCIRPQMTDFDQEFWELLPTFEVFSLYMWPKGKHFSVPEHLIVTIQTHLWGGGKEGRNQVFHWKLKPVETLKLAYNYAEGWKHLDVDIGSAIRATGPKCRIPVRTQIQIWSQGHTDKMLELEEVLRKGGGSLLKTRVQWLWVN